MFDTKFVIDEIKKLELKNKETDIVVISFDINDFNLEIMKTISNQVIQNFADYTVGFIPKGMEVEVKDIDSMIQYLEGVKQDNLSGQTLLR